MRSFPLAPMSPLVRALTLLLLTLPFVFLLASLFGAPGVLAAAGALLGSLYAAVWAWLRPSSFEVGEGRLDLIFPARHRHYDLTEIATCRALSAAECRGELGFSLRVGVGGLWGGFGRLWTSRRGWVDFFVSATDRFVLVDRREARPLLLTPADCDGLVAALRDAGVPAA